MFLQLQNRLNPLLANRKLLADCMDPNVQFFPLSRFSLPQSTFIYVYVFLRGIEGLQGRENRSSRGTAGVHFVVDEVFEGVGEWRRGTEGGIGGVWLYAEKQRVK